MRFPFECFPHRSLFFTVALVGIHSLAVLAILLTPIVWFVCVPLLGLVGLSAWRSLRRPFPTFVRVERDGCVSYRLNASIVGSGRLLLDSTVFRALILLRVQDEQTGRVTALILCRDTLPRDVFRELYVALRWGLQRDEAPLA